MIGKNENLASINIDMDQSRKSSCIYLVIEYSVLNIFQGLLQDIKLYPQK